MGAVQVRLMAPASPPATTSPQDQCRGMNIQVTECPWIGQEGMGGGLRILGRSETSRLFRVNCGDLDPGAAVAAAVGNWRGGIVAERHSILTGNHITINIREYY